MNWPFLEECVQDGANREMDEEDKPSPPEAESWKIGHTNMTLKDDGIIKKQTYIYCGTAAARVLFVVDEATDEELRVAVAAPQMRDALKRISNDDTYAPFPAREIARIALEKAGG